MAIYGLKPQVLALSTIDTLDGVVAPSGAYTSLVPRQGTFMKHHTGKAIDNVHQYPGCMPPQSSQMGANACGKTPQRKHGGHLVATWRLDPRPHKDSMLRATTRFGTSAGHFA